MSTKPLNKLRSIKQNIHLYTNYLNNTVIYTVSYAYIIVYYAQRSSAITETFILGKKPRLSFDKITKNAISETFILKFHTIFFMMSEMLRDGSPYRYIGNNNDGELLFSVHSKSSNIIYTISVSIIHDESLSNVPRINVKHIDDDECEGYKHRENCWHINDIHLDECSLCLTPFILRTARVQDNLKQVKLVDQEDNIVWNNEEKITSKTFRINYDYTIKDIYTHDKCQVILEEELS